MVTPAFSGESLHWFLFARLSVLFSALVAIIVTGATHHGSLETSASAYSLLTVSFAFTFISAVLLERLPQGFGLASVQITFDAFMTALWLRIIGSDGGAMVLFFIVQILASALTFYKRGAWFASLATTLAYAMATVGKSEPLTILTYGILFLVIGTTGGYLAEELSRITKTLAKKQLTIDKLTELQERILKDLPTGLLTVDGALIINFVNPAAAQILGSSAEGLAGKNLAVVAPDLLPFFSSIEIESLEAPGSRQDDLEAAATHSRNHRSVFVHSRNDRKRFGQRVEIGEGKEARVLRGDVAHLGSAIEGSGLLKAHVTEGRLVLFQDVTLVDSLEERLRQNEKLAAVGQLAAGIAHEIRNPLASMSASIEMLRESLVPTRGNENQRLMDITIREIDRLNELVTEFLDYVKPDRLKMATVDIGQLVLEMVESMQRRKDLPKGVSIRVRAQPGVTATANREKLAQVILNLMLNAVQAIPGSGNVEVGCRSDNNKTLIWVEDSGCGMTEVVKRRLFEPFFTTKPKGTGLGLATVYKIVQAHEGTIVATSEEGKGSRFEIVLGKVNA